jgi:ribosomal protein S18 acetylase RimI-like enzyme
MESVTAARYATHDDLPALVRLINLAYRVEDFFVNGDRTNTNEIAVRLAEPNVRFLVVPVKDSEDLAGAVEVEVTGDRGHFAMLSVDPAFQGQGLGRLLVNAVEDHCRSAGCNALDLEIVNLRLELPAYYAKLGFTPVRTAAFPRKEKLTRNAHLVIMSKSLATY